MAGYRDGGRQARYAAADYQYVCESVGDAGDRKMGEIAPPEGVRARGKAIFDGWVGYLILFNVLAYGLLVGPFGVRQCIAGPSVPGRAVNLCERRPSRPRIIIL